jgi:MscS family membrane protein
MAAATIFALFLLMSSGQAQETTSAESPQSGFQPVDDALQRGTPRGSLEGFLKAIEKDDYVTAVEYLDLRNLPRKYRSAQPTRLAQMLAIIIEREIWIDLEQLSNESQGNVGDGLPPYRDELGRIEDEDTHNEIILLMQRVPRDDGKLIWKVSNATIAEIADLYDKYGYGPIAEAIARAVPNAHFLGVELFKWVMILGGGLIAYPLAIFLGLGLARLFSSPTSPLYPRVKRFFIGPFSLLAVVLTMDLIIRQLGLGLTGQKIAQAATVNTIIITWLLLSGTSLIRDVYARRLQIDGREGAMVLLRPTAQATQILVVIIAALVWLDNAGFNITTLLAGLGVGGIAMALALQKPLEDVLGALALYTQQPVRIGDFCRIGGEIGTIEEIGLRTTRIRTLANTVISVPNSKLIGEAIDNISARQMILYNPTIRLRIETTRDQLEKVLDGIRGLLASHEKVVQQNPRVRFQNIGKDALELVIFAYTDTQIFPEYLEIAEDLNIKVLNIIAEAGTALALPGQLLYTQGSPDPDVP